MLPKALSRALRIWHRRIGIVVANVLLIVSVTGIALNHVAGFQLDRITVSSPALLALYDIPQVSEDVQAYQVNGQYVALVAGRLFIDGKQVLGESGPIVGAAATGEFTAVAEESRVHLFLSDGQFVESIAISRLESPLVGLASDGETFVAVTDTGAYAANGSLSRWEPVDWPERIAPTSSLPAEVRERINQHLSGTGLPLYRIVLDIHSGRILGHLGPWLMDIAGVLIIILSITGLWMWLGYRH